MANLKVTLELDNQGYLRAIRASDDATKKFAADAQTAANQSNSAFEKLGATTEKLRGHFARLGSAVVGVALVGLTRSVIQTSDAVVDLANATEFSVAKIFELQQALQQSGGEAQNAAKLITEFYKSIDEAAKGSDKTQEAFAKVGVSLKQLSNLSTGQLFDAAVKGLNSIKDPAERTATAIQLFGKSMVGVSPEDLNNKLEELRGRYEEQAEAARKAAELNDRYQEAINNLRMAFLNIISPVIDFINNLAKSEEKLNQLINLLKVLGGLLLAGLGFTVFGRLATIIGSIGRGMSALVGTTTKLGEKLGSIFAVNGTVMNGFRTLMKLLGLGAGVAAGVAVATSGEERDAGGGRGFINPPLVNPEPDGPKRVVETGKELQSQLNTINQMADGYRRAAQANMDRYSLEVELLGKTKEEQDMIKGTAEINKRYADQTAALEDKKKGAKGATLALINKEIKDLEQLRISELDIFQINQEKLAAYRRQQQEIKNIIDLMEQQAEYDREIAEFMRQQDQARLAAWEQVNAVKENLALTTQREQLEKSIALLRGTDQTAIRNIFDLEQQRRQELEKIAKIQNLPYDERLKKEEEINKLYDERRLTLENNYILEKTNQDSFVQGWQDALTRWRNNFKTEAEYAADIFGSVTRGFEDAFVKFVQTGKLSFRSLANDIIAQATRMAANKLLMSIFGSLFGGSGGSFFGSLFGGKAGGGNVEGNTPYVVGERGPELFVPNNAGKIISNKDLQTSTQPTVINNAVSYQIQAVDASSFRSLVARDPEFIFNVTEQGRRSLPTRSRR